MFIDQIGINSISAFCNASGLQYIDSNGESVDILQIGFGQANVCEVCIQYSPNISIIVTPFPSVVVINLVNNLASFIPRFTLYAITKLK